MFTTQVLVVICRKLKSEKCPLRPPLPSPNMCSALNQHWEEEYVNQHNINSRQELASAASAIFVQHLG